MIDPSSAIWGYGFGCEMARMEAKAKKAKRRERRELEGFAIESAEFKDGLILVKAVNIDDVSNTVDDVSVMEVYPEPKVKKIGFLTWKKTWEWLRCKWKASSFSVGPWESVDVWIEPRRPLKEGYKYVIHVCIRLPLEEDEDMYTSVGVPASYIYSNGKLERVQGEKPKWKFCINCGSKLPPLAKYCLTCGEKQEF